MFGWTAGWLVLIWVLSMMGGKPVTQPHRRKVKVNFKCTILCLPPPKPLQNVFFLQEQVLHLRQWIYYHHTALTDKLQIKDKICRERNVDISWEMTTKSEQQLTMATSFRWTVVTHLMCDNGFDQTCDSLCLILRLLKKWEKKVKKKTLSCKCTWHRSFGFGKLVLVTCIECGLGNLFCCQMPQTGIQFKQIIKAFYHYRW